MLQDTVTMGSPSAGTYHTFECEKVTPFSLIYPKNWWWWWAGSLKCYKSKPT